MDAAAAALDALILDQAADAIVYADRDGIIRRWNRAAEALFGYAAADALGRSVELIVPEKLRPAHWRGFDAAIESGTLKLSGKPTLTRSQHPNGDKLYVELSFALVKDSASGALVGAVAVARDATERVAAQRAWADETPSPRCQARAASSPSAAAQACGIAWLI